MLVNDDLSDPRLSKGGKLPYRRFQLLFPGHHETLLKINEDQSIITNKFKPLCLGEWGGVTIYCCDIDEALADTKGDLCDVTGVI